MYPGSISTALALTWTAGQAYRVDLYLGQACRGADAGEIKTSEARSCSNSPSQAQSAYISRNNDKDDELELLFKTGRTCTGDIISGATGPGCITFDGTMESIEVSRIGPKRNAQPETAINSTWMNGVETVNNILRQNNITVSDDDEDMGEGWLTVGLGRWIGVADDKTAAQFACELDDAGFITRSWTDNDILEMAGEFSAPGVHERFSDGDELLPGSSSADGGLSSRDSFLGVRCNRAAVCAFGIGGAIQTSYNAFIKVYDGLTQTRL